MPLKHCYGHLQAMQAVVHSVRQNFVCAWLGHQQWQCLRHPMRLQEHDHAAVMQDICAALVWQQ